MTANSGMVANLSSRMGEETQAFWLFAVFATSIFFMKGVPASATAIVCFAIGLAWIISRRSRGETLTRGLDWISLAALAAFTLRQLLPAPYQGGEGFFSP